NVVILGTFTDPGIAPTGTVLEDPFADYSATVNWGDNTSDDSTTSTNVFIVRTARNLFVVEGLHTYAMDSVTGFTVTTTVHHESAPDAIVNTQRAFVAGARKSVSVSKSLLTDADVGSIFQVIATYNEPMSTAAPDAPTVGFGQAVNTTLTNPS